MYHVSKDKRAVKSAELIWQGLRECLKEKKIGKIHIADINEKSYISRATFYRLFDSVEDVLVYECDQLFEQVSIKLVEKQFSSTRDFFLFFIQQLLEHKDLMMGLAANNLTHIIHDVHMRYRILVQDVIIRGDSMGSEEVDYLVAILSGILPAAMEVWYLHGQKESPEEIYKMVAGSISVIDNALNNQKHASSTISV